MRGENDSGDSDSDSDDDENATDGRKAKVNSRKQSDSDKVYTAKSKHMRIRKYTGDRLYVFNAFIFIQYLCTCYTFHIQHKSTLGEAELQSAVEAAAVVFKKVVLQRREAAHKKEMRDKGECMKT